MSNNYNSPFYNNNMSNSTLPDISLDNITSISNKRKSTTTSHGAKKHKNTTHTKDKEEEELESYLFGDITNEINITNDISELKDVEDFKDKQLFIDERQPKEIEKPVWYDPDDENIQIDISEVNALADYIIPENTIVSGAVLNEKLREHHAILHPVSSDSFSNSNTASATTRLANNFTNTNILPRNNLSVSRMNDANQHEYSKCVIQACEFHPNKQMILTAGLDKTLRLFQIDGLANTKLSSTFYNDFPITNAHFTRDGLEVILSSNRPYFYSYDLSTDTVTKVPSLRGRSEKSLPIFSVSPSNEFLSFVGDHGSVHLVSKTSKQLVHTYSINGTSTSSTFSPDGKYLFCSGSDGHVYTFDLKMNKCVGKKADIESNTCLAVGVNNFATGSASGIVHLFDRYKGDDDYEPYGTCKEYLNLTTSIDALSINSTEEIMAFSSKRKRDQLRLVHLGSKSVFSNWPTGQTPLGFVNTISFSPLSGYMAIGNDRGKVLLYRLNYYGSY